MRKSHRKGFTIVELIIVIAVIGVLAAILIPVFSNVIQKANAKSAMSDARNTLTNYIVEMTENPTLPDDVVIFVEKAGNFYVFGYNKTEAQLVESPHNPVKAASLADLVANYNLPFAQYGDYVAAVEANGAESSQAEGIRGNNVFTLEAAPAPAASVKGMANVKSEPISGFNCLNNAVPEKSRLDKVDLYQGYVLGGVVVPTDNNGGNGGGEGGNGGEGGGNVPTPTPEPTPTPTPVTKYTVSFAAGSADGTFNASNVTLPEAVEVEENDIFIPSGYQASYANTEGIDTYTFAGWMNGSEDVAGSIAVTGNVTLTAKWTRVQSFAITFTADTNITYGTVEGWSNGGRLSNQTDIQNLVKDTKAADKSQARTFLGWQINGTGTVYTAATAGSIVVTGDTTFKAAYKEPLSVKINPANGTAEYAYNYNNSTEFYNGQAIHLPAAPTAPSGKQFAGWKSSIAAQASTNFVAGGDYTVTENVTFTAQWATLYTVTYNVNGGTAGNGFTSSYSVVAGGTHTVQSASAVTYAGHSFAGWSDGTTTHQPGASITVNGNVTLTAQWTVIKHTITFVPGDDQVQGTQAPVQVEHGAQYTVPTTTTFTFTGFKFSGWSLTQNGTLITAPITVEADITLYAQWQREYYFVTYNANGNGATCNIGMQVASYGIPFTPTAPSANEVTWAGHNFLGWGISPTGGVATFPMYLTSNITLYAQWEEVQQSGREVTLTLYDTWNETNAGTVKVNVEGTSIAKSTIDAAATEQGVLYWVSDADATIAADATTATINGQRLATTTAARSATNATYTTYAGTGDVYQGLTTIKGLEKIEQNLTKNFLLIEDIYLSDEYNWMPIGGPDSPYTGIFDGGHHTIDNLVINYGDYNYIGFFATLGNSSNVGTLRSLNINLDIVNGTSYVGAVAGINNGAIYGVSVKQASYGDGEDAPYAQAKIAGGSNAYLGGFVGLNNGAIQFSNCALDEVLSDGNRVGGFVGENNGAIDQCWNTTRVNYSFYSDTSWSLESQRTGGFVGNNTGYITNCYANVGLVAGFLQVGGFVGWNSGTIQYNWCFVGSMFCQAKANNVSGAASYYSDSIGNAAGGTVSGNISVRSKAILARTGWTIKSLDNFKAMTSYSGWDTNKWDMTAGQLKTLKNNPYPAQ